MEFTSEIPASVNNINKVLGIDPAVDIETGSPQLTVKWAADIEAREYGIKSIIHYPMEEKLECVVEWEIDPDGLTDADIEQIKAAGGVEQRNDKWVGSWKVPNEWLILWQLRMDEGSLYPTDAYIDCNEQKITID
jgi:hypothetical protein